MSHPDEACDKLREAIAATDVAYACYRLALTEAEGRGEKLDSLDEAIQKYLDSLDAYAEAVRACVTEPKRKEQP